MEANSLTMKATSKAPAHGFTLIELMIVVAVLGILAAIALPSYNAYLIKTRRVAATGCLQQQAQFMERYYTTNMRYTGATLPGGCDPGLNDFYTFSFTATPTAKAFTIRAVPTGRQSDPTCGTLTLNQAGTRTESGSGALTDCW